MGTVGALALGALACCPSIAGCSGDPAGRASARPPTAQATPAAFVHVAGARLPYVGAIPWSGAVASGAAHEDVTVYADGDRVGHGICPLPSERVVVRESRTTVTITVAGYGLPLPSGDGCAAVGHSPQPHTVRLREPLGDRRLVDTSDGAVHPVLDAETAPRLPGLAREFVPLPVRWDDEGGSVISSWEVPGTRFPEAISLSRGPAVAPPADAPAGGPPVPSPSETTTTVDIGGRPATVTDSTDQYGESVGVEWRQPDGQELDLAVSWPPGSHLGVDDALRLARSAR